MEKLEQTKSEFLAPVVLWADDVKDILSFAAELGEEIRFDVGGYRYADFAEFMDRSGGKVFRKMDIGIGFSKFTLSVSGKMPYIYSSSSSPLYLGVYLQIKEVLERRAIKSNPLLNPLMPWIFYAPCFVLGLVFSRYYLEIIAAPFIITLLWTYTINRKRVEVCKINSDYLKPKPDFWSENRDKIALAAISSLIGGIIAIVVGCSVYFLTHEETKKPSPAPARTGSP